MLFDFKGIIFLNHKRYKKTKENPIIATKAPRRKVYFKMPNDYVPLFLIKLSLTIFMSFNLSKNHYI